MREFSGKVIDLASEAQAGPVAVPPSDSLIPSVFLKTDSIFIHIPKTAGSTIALGLYGFRIGHHSIQSLFNINSVFSETAFKFAFVRHPYYRFLSAYNYLSRGGMSSTDLKLRNDNSKAFASPRALAEACESPEFRDSILHLRPQFKFVSVPANNPYKIFMDFVCKTEFFSRGLNELRVLAPQALSERIRFISQEHLNATAGDRVLDDDLFKSIRKSYELDFDLFGYDEWNTIERAEKLMLQSSIGKLSAGPLSR
jgi:hypothetical protein